MKLGLVRAIPSSASTQGRRVKRRALVVRGLMVFALVTLLAAGSDLLSILRANSWPSVPGEVREAKLINLNSGKGRGHFAFRLRYSYRVNNQEYEGWQVCPRDSLVEPVGEEKVGFSFSSLAYDTFFSPMGYHRYGHHSQSVVEQYVKRYRPAEKVMVYYDESDPSLAVLQRGLDWGNLKHFVFTVLLSVVAIMAFVFHKIVWRIIDLMRQRGSLPVAE